MVDQGRGIDGASWPIVGHEQAVSLLQRSIVSGHVAHAYLFTGPAHVGKATLARVMAQALNCECVGAACGECRSCRLIEDDRHHDVQVVQAGDGNADAEAPTSRSGKRSSKSIGIEQIRAMQRDAALAPYEARRKVYIILDAEHMTVEAANCLLKTLEEPPGTVILILTTSDPSMLLPTVVSRCQQVTLRPSAKSMVAEALKRDFGASDDEADMLARLSRGCVGWAVGALRNPKILGNRTAQLERMVSVMGASRVQRFKLAEKLSTEFSGNQLGLRAILGLWLEWWRDLLLVKIRCTDMVTNVESMPVLEDIAACTSLNGIYAFARELESTMRDLEANANVRLALEALMLRMPVNEHLSAVHRR